MNPIPLSLVAVISGQALINSLVWLIIAGLIFWLLLWLIDCVRIPEPFNKAAKVILAVAAVIFLIGFLMSLAGHPLVVW